MKYLHAVVPGLHAVVPGLHAVSINDFYSMFKSLYWVL